MKRRSLIYYFLKRYSYLASRLFYRRLTVHNVKNVTVNGPLIFVPNHQNAFMDAIMVTVASPRNPWYLTRASVFGNATVRYWLNSLQMIPIYRFRDGFQNVKKNDATVELSLKLLSENETILIFAEGNHDCRWSLRPLQKGLARISFAFESSVDFTGNLKIVPVGLQYEDHNRFRSELLINFGEPIKVSDYKDIYQTDPIQATAQIIGDVNRELGDLIINIQQTDRHDEIKAVIKRRINREDDLLKRLKGDQQFLKHGDFSKTDSQPVKVNIILAIVAFPVFVYGFLNHIIIIAGIKLILSKLMSDKHWTSSFKFAGMIFLTPVIYFLQSLLVYHFYPDLMFVMVYIASLPVTAVIAGDYYHKVLQHND
jgi:1-acyl-sn-glycerol-3-phosphate acyltransferase